MGAVNIFLGGTGKYIAADIESQIRFFGLNISDPVAFDLDGSSPIPGTPLRGLIGADPGTDEAVMQRASEWAATASGDGVGPAEEKDALQAREIVGQSLGDFRLRPEHIHGQLAEVAMPGCPVELGDHGFAAELLTLDVRA